LQKKYRLDTLQAALRLIDFLLESSESELGVSEISRGLGLNKSQTYRILQNLVEYSYVNKKPDTRKYQLGTKFLLAGRIVSERLDILREAGPVMDQLRDHTDETVHLVLRRDLGPVCIAERQSSHRLRFFASVGLRLPWHAGSASKLLLAHLPRERREEILSRGSLEAFTPNTITDPERLRTELDQILADGYATSESEMTVGAWAVAAPIHTHTGAVTAAISVVAPPERLEDGKRQVTIARVIDAARAISARLGFVDSRDQLPAISVASKPSS
jgi:DNA-binding IclR family transcriptional regulator